MTEITIDIEADECSEYCDGCRFLSEADEECLLFEQPIYYDATMSFTRCEVCCEREIREDG